MKDRQLVDEMPYHITSYSAAVEIASKGLDPDHGGGLFSHGGYKSRSKKRIFLAEGRQAALGWFTKVAAMLEYQSGDSAYAEDLVAVILRVSLPADAELEVDTEGSRDVLGGTEHSSWYVESSIPPEDLEAWNPVTGVWMPLTEWVDADLDASLGVAEIEMYDADGDPTTNKADADSLSITTFGAYDSGGFKPNKDSDAWD